MGRSIRSGTCLIAGNSLELIILQNSFEIKTGLNVLKMIRLDNQQRSSEQENVQRSSPRRGVGRVESPEKAGLCGCVYTLKDSRDNRIRYVGKTSCKLSKRIREHVQDSRRWNTKVSRWVFGRIDRGYDIIMTPILCGVNIENWERRFIKILRRRGFQLLNMTDGGDGVPGNKQSAETKLKKSLAMTGKPKSPEHIEKMRLLFSKEVHMYRKSDRMYLMSYQNSKVAAEILNRDSSAIYAAIKRHGGCAGYLFSYTKYEQLPHKEDMIHTT